MKKGISLLIAILLFAASTCTGTAESGTIPSIRETMQSESEVQPFSFRGGIGWNMDMQQVKLLENSPMEERSSTEWSIMINSEPVTVSRFTADLVFMFYQNQLKMITYEFQSGASTLNYQYLLGALSSVYGDSVDTDGLVIKSMMDRIYPDRYRGDWIREGHMWTAKDGTHIFLYYFSANAYAILYTCPELTVRSTGGYDVNGL